MPKSESIVLELQRLGTDNRHDVADLLRKALLVASKLKLNDFREWINNELQGYRGDAVVPHYRKVRCQMKLDNPYRGLVPFIFADPKVASKFCDVEVTLAIGELMHLLAGADHTGYMVMTLSNQEAMCLWQAQEDAIGIALPPVRIFGESAIAGIIDVVRSTILDWALQLEAKGILGEGLSFTDAEKRTAASSPEIRIENFQGVLGNVTNSNLNQQLQMQRRRK